MHHVIPFSLKFSSMRWTMSPPRRQLMWSLHTWRRIPATVYRCRLNRLRPTKRMPRFYWKQVSMDSGLRESPIIILIPQFVTSMRRVLRRNKRRILYWTPLSLAWLRKPWRVSRRHWVCPPLVHRMDRRGICDSGAIWMTPSRSICCRWCHQRTLFRRLCAVLSSDWTSPTVGLR